MESIFRPRGRRTLLAGTTASLASAGLAALKHAGTWRRNDSMQCTIHEVTEFEIIL